MNKVYLIGKIIEISDYKFFYNSKKYDSKITITIKTLESIYRSGEIIEISAYNNVADKVYRYCKNNDIISVEGKIGKNMEIEIIYLFNIKNNGNLA